MFFDMRMVVLETDEMYGTVTYILNDGNSSYVVTVIEQPWRDNNTLVTKSFGNGVRAEDFLLKVLCNPTFYKIKYS